MLKFRDRSHVGQELVIGTEGGVALARIPPGIRQQIQYLWTRLLVHDGEVPHSVGVTSQLSGEGVSFTSRALAAVVGRTRRTCLVEANWWGTGVPLPDPNPGLAGVLQGSSQIDDVLVQTNHPGLAILPSGELPASGRAVVSNTEAMSALLEELRHRFEHVVIDLPAITTSATALSFAATAESSLLVVRQRVTRIDQVESATSDLRHTRLLGVVLNDNRVSMPRFLQRRLLDA